MTPEIAKELIAALDDMPPERRGLITLTVWDGKGRCCAVGALISYRGGRCNTPLLLDDLICSIARENDRFEGTPEARWQHMREWAQGIVDGAMARGEGE